MNSITTDITDLIEKNLPSATAGVMKDFIKESEETVKELSRTYKIVSKQAEHIKQQDVTIKELQNTITEYEDISVLENELTDRESKVSIREQKLDLEVSNIRLQEAAARNGIMENLVRTVFGHPSVTVTNQKSVVTPVPGSNDCCGYVDQRDVTNTTITTESKA